MKHLLLFVIVICLVSICHAQKDTAEMNKIINQYNIQIDLNNLPKNEKEAEEYKKKIMKQINNKNIDPNAINKNDIENYKNQTLKKAQELKKKYSEYDLNAPVKKKPYIVKNIDIKAVEQSQILKIAQRFYNQSYKVLVPANKVKFDADLKRLSDASDKAKIARQYTGIGANLTALSEDPDLACVYLTSAVLNAPSDTFAINNFGAYLRIIDSVQVSLPVLLYASSLCTSSPLILTQIGNSLFELGDHLKAEKYFKEALKSNPDFDPAHTGLCCVYMVRGDAKNAIVELFKGVKTVFPPSAPKAYQNLLKEFGNSGKTGEFPADELLKTATSESFDVSNVKRIGLPNFPVYKDVNSWALSGYNEAVLRYQNFVKYDIAWIKKMQADYQTSTPLDQYEKEYFMVTSILSLIDTIHLREERKLLKEIDKLHESTNKQYEIYLDKFSRFSEELTRCMLACGNESCVKACQRKFCSQNCPNADETNTIIKGDFESFNSLFAKYRNAQRQNIKDAYNFTQPWIDKIYSLGWSKVTEYDRKRVVLKIIGSCYLNYCYHTPMLQQGCEDCSIIYEQEEQEQEDVEDKDVEGNDCKEGVKQKIEILVCEISKDCDGIEFGCTAVVSASVKRNMRNKSTTVFVGVGGKASLGFAEASGKAGFTYTRGDNGTENGGIKVEGGLSTGVGVKTGQSVELDCTLMGGLNVQRSSEIGIGF